MRSKILLSSSLMFVLSFPYILSGFTQPALHVPVTFPHSFLIFTKKTEYKNLDNASNTLINIGAKIGRLMEDGSIVGGVYRRATGFNAKFIKQNKIGPGSKLLIIRTGDVFLTLDKS